MSEKTTERHGHVLPNPNGLLARCGGPALCTICARELGSLSLEELKAYVERKERDSIMSVRAKFKCTANDAGNIELWPVVGGSNNAENDAFYEATPGGRIQLSIVNEAAAEQFEVDKSYYVDFTKAE